MQTEPVSYNPYMQAWINPAQNCPKCDSNMITGHKTCLKCGTGMLIKVKEDLPMSEEIRKQPTEYVLTEHVCTQCGETYLKGKKAKRTLCKKCEDKRINANRKRGFKLCRATKQYGCIYCHGVIKPAEKHWCDSRSNRMWKRWCQKCNAEIHSKQPVSLSECA